MPCNEYGDKLVAADLMKLIPDHVKNNNNMDKNIGEKVAYQTVLAAYKDKGIYGVADFIPTLNGFDGVFKDSNGVIYLVEAKHNNGGRLDFSKTKNGREQMSWGWVFDVTKNMSLKDFEKGIKENRRYARETTHEVAREIYEALEKGKVELVTITLDNSAQEDHFANLYTYNGDKWEANYSYNTSQAYDPYLDGDEVATENIDSIEELDPY